MARAALVPISLPADPVNPLEAVTKQYVDRLTGQSWTFDTATATNAAPAGTVRYNAATAAGTSFIGIAKTNAAGVDISTLLSRIARGTVLLIRSAAGVAHAFAVQSDPSSFATCYEWNVTPLVTTGTMTNGVSLAIDTGYDVRYNFIEDLADVAHSASSGMKTGQNLQFDAGTGLWEAKDDGLFVGTADPGTGLGYEMWYDTDAPAPVGTTGVPIYANLAALPTDIVAGRIAGTTDGVAWVQLATGAWRPLTTAAQVFTVALSGSVPSSGSLTTQSISIPAVGYNRHIQMNGMVLVSPSAANSVFQFSLTHPDGTNLFSRALMGNTGSIQTIVIPPYVGTLAANTAGTIASAVSWNAGTAASATIINDARFCRIDAMAWAT